MSAIVHIQNLPPIPVASITAALELVAAQPVATRPGARIELDQDDWSMDDFLLVAGLPTSSLADLVTIEGAGPETGRTQLYLPSLLPWHVRVTVAGIRFRRIDFHFGRLGGAPPGGPEFNLRSASPTDGILLEGTSVLELVDCTLWGPAWEDDDPELQGDRGVAMAGSSSAEIMVRLRGARFEGWARGVSLDGWSGSEPSCSLRAEDSGFRRCGRGIHAQDVELVNVRTSRFDHNETAIRLSDGGVGVAPTNWSVLDNQFTDNLRGVALLRGPSGASQDSSSSRHQISAVVERNEFRAPNRRAFPRPFDSELLDDDGVHAHHETRGLVVRLPNGGTSAKSQGRSVVIRCNVFHFLDTALDLHAPDTALLSVEHNTFEANSVRGVLIRSYPNEWAGPRTKLLMHRNLFIGREGRPWLGVTEGEYLAGRGGNPGLAGRYLFGAIELAERWPRWTIPSTPTLGTPITIVRNLFHGHGDSPLDFPKSGTPHTLIYYRPTPDSPNDLVRRFSQGDHWHEGAQWGNDVATAATASAVLRLSRCFTLDADAGQQMVTFDAHLAVDSREAVVLGFESAQPFDYLAVLQIAQAAPGSDFYGQPWKSPAVGAGNPEPRWKQFPILNAGGLTQEAAWASDAVTWTRWFVPLNLTDSPDGPPSVKDERNLIFNGCGSPGTTAKS